MATQHAAASTASLRGSYAFESNATHYVNHRSYICRQGQVRWLFLLMPAATAASSPPAVRWYPSQSLPSSGRASRYGSGRAALSRVAWHPSDRHAGLGARPCKEKVYRQALSRCQVSCEPVSYDEFLGEGFRLHHIVCLACAHDPYGFWARCLLL